MVCSVEDTSPFKVLRLTPFFLHASAETWPAEYDPVGGMQVQTLEFSRWLEAQGIPQTIICMGLPSVPRQYSLGSHSRVCSTWHFLPRIRSRRTGLLGRVECWALEVCLRCLFGEYDETGVIHLHADGEWSTMAAGLFVARMLGKPLVVTLHCSRLCSYHPLSFVDRTLHRIACFFERRLLSSAEQIITLTETTRSTLINRYPHTHAITVPDGLDVDWVKSCGSSRISQFGLTDFLQNRPVLAFCGRIAPEKGWPMLLDVLDGLGDPRASLLVIGDGPEREVLLAHASMRGLASRVHVTGFVPRADALALLARVDVLLAPSRHEELGSVVLEALALRVPVVASRVSGFVSTLGDCFPESLVDPDDTCGFIRATVIALQKGMPSPSAMTKTLSHYGYDQVFCMGLDVYKKILRHVANT